MSSSVNIEARPLELLGRQSESDTVGDSYCYDRPSMYSIKNITYFRVLFYFIFVPITNYEVLTM